jgi:DNA-binding NtrC family response regulator
MSDAPAKFTQDTSSAETRVVNKDTLVGLGAERLAQVVLDSAASDPNLLENVRRRMADQPAEVGTRDVRVRSARGDPDEPHMVGSDPSMQHVYDTIRKIAVTAAPVLLGGESGTGKELAALAIHERSPYSSGPFVPINCGALPPQLIASELFGHEKGAFTGADQRHIGRIESAAGGSVLLDEIGDLPLELQAHLLRFLQEGTIDRVGSRQHIKVDVRVIAATNADLRQAVADGKFRGDLYYRLNVLRLELPPGRRCASAAKILICWRPTFCAYSPTKWAGRSAACRTTRSV